MSPLAVPKTLTTDTNGTLAARLPFRRFRFCVSRLWTALTLGALDRVCTSRLVNRMRFGHWVVLQLGNRAPCAAVPPPKAPPLRRGTLAVGAMPSRQPTTSAWTLSSRPKSNSSGKFCETFKRGILPSFQSLRSTAGPRVRIPLGPPDNGRNQPFYQGFSHPIYDLIIVVRSHWCGTSPPDQWRCDRLRGLL
jgi:hypothetical protein